MREIVFDTLRMAGPWERLQFFKAFIYDAKCFARHEEEIDWGHYLQYYLDLYERKYGKVEWYIG